MQQPTDQSVDQSVDQRKDVAGQYLDIALVAGQYKIYCSAMSFDPPTQSVTYIYIYTHTYTHTCTHTCTHTHMYTYML